MLFPDFTITALLGKACGDGWAAPFEFHVGASEFARLSMTEGRYLDTRADCKQPIRRVRTSGLYTDDTQQALVLLWIWAQLVKKGKNPHRAASVAELFVKACRRMASEPVPGNTSFGVHRGTGKNFREAIGRGVIPDTAGLGGAMRIGPVATLIDDPSLVMPWAVEVTSTTTSNAVALAGTARIAAYAWNLARGDGWVPLDAEKFGFSALAPEVQDAWYLMSKAGEALRNRGEEGLLDFASKSGVAGRDLKSAADGFALTGVPWILHCVDEATSYEDALLRVCASGGDTDTVAAIAGCLAALRFGRDSVPAWMVRDLVGRDHILDPNLWHPLATEKAFVQMDVALQARMEAEARADAKARAQEKAKARAEARKAKSS